LSHYACGPIVEAIARAKHQEAIEEARVQHIIKTIRGARPSRFQPIAVAARQAISSVRRIVAQIIAKLEEKQRPIL
jgi:hypothetical protein